MDGFNQLGPLSVLERLNATEATKSITTGARSENIPKQLRQNIWDVPRNAAKVSKGSYFTAPKSTPGVLDMHRIIDTNKNKSRGLSPLIPTKPGGRVGLGNILNLRGGFVERVHIGTKIVAQVYPSLNCI